MTVQDILQWIDAIAPFATQDTYDNSGLLLGDPAVTVHRILFTLDVTPAAAAKAAQTGAELIVSHHPLMFDSIRQVRYDRGEGAVIRALAASGISLIAAHTNLDRCAGGVADSLAQTLSLEKITASDADPYLRTGEAAAPCTAMEFLLRVNRSLHASARLYGDPGVSIRRVAVAPGAGGDAYPHAEADALVTGEIKHHEIIAALDRGLLVYEAGHYPTEFPGIAALYQRFTAAASHQGWAVEAALATEPPYPCVTHA